MKWTEPKPKFKAGEKRIVKRFLLMPTKPMFSHEWRWLEYAHIEQEWLEGIFVKFWCNIRWKDI